MALQFHRKIKSYVKKLQRGDDKTKKRWLIGTSAVSMVLIVALWFVYLNLSLPQLASEKEVSGETKEPPKEGFFDTMSRGMKNTRDEFDKQWKNFKDDLNKNLGVLKERFQESNAFSLENEKKTFVPPPQAPIPTSTLP